jgi:hypothetical protein
MMAKTKTGYLTMDWTDGEGNVHPEGEGVEFPYDSHDAQVDYELLVRQAIITHTARQAAKVAEALNPEPAEDKKG